MRYYELVALLEAKKAKINANETNRTEQQVCFMLDQIDGLIDRADKAHAAASITEASHTKQVHADNKTLWEKSQGVFVMVRPTEDKSGTNQLKTGLLLAALIVILILVVIQIPGV